MEARWKRSYATDLPECQLHYWNYFSLKNRVTVESVDTALELSNDTEIGIT